MKSKLLKTVDRILEGKKPKAKPQARQRTRTPKQKNINPSFTKKGLLTDVFNILTKNQYKDIVKESQQATDFLTLPDRPETIDIDFEVVGEEQKPTYQNDKLLCADVQINYDVLLEKYNALKTETRPAAQQEEPIEEGSNFVSLVSLDKIKTNTHIFQNRDNEYSERSVYSILNAVNSNTFNWQELDPILLFRDKNDLFGDLYILSGHSRTEAFRRLSTQGKRYKGRSFDKIPAKIIITSVEEARKIAKRSNTLNTAETDIERAKFYKELRNEEQGISFNKLEKLAKDREGDDWLYRLNLSYLNPNGNALDALRLLQNATEQENRTVRTLADWTGEARRAYPLLTNSHENEIFDWLMTEAYGTKQGQFTNKKKFLARLDQSIAKINFEADKPLNLKKAMQRTPVEEAYFKQLEEAKRELKQAKDNLETKRKELAINYPKPTAEQSELIKNILGNLNLQIQAAQRKFINIDQQYEKVMQAAKNQVQLFGLKGIANFAGMENIKDKIKALAQEAIKNANENKWLEIGILTTKEIQNINQSTGIDLTGYVRILDMAGINHALRKHGSEKEYLRGQIPVTINDFELIPDIVANPDEVEKVETNKRGLEVILYTKKIGATYYYYEEIRTGRKKVALNTMYKK
jgi:phage-Barnase-EndoU-ColicinE5/D-RelE like nuclease3